MDHPNENLAYSARFGLKHSLDNVDKAVKIAVAKYRSIVKRQLHTQEIFDLKTLVSDLQNWQLENQFARSVVGFS